MQPDLTPTGEPHDAVAAASHLDPYAYYRALREQRPLYWDSALGLWVASSGAAVVAALQHPSLRVRPPAEPVPRGLAGTAAGGIFSRLVRMNDGEFHAQRKPVVAAELRAVDLQRVGEQAGLALAELLPRGDANRLLTALPVRTLAGLLGVPRGRLDEVTQQVLDFVRGIAAAASAETIEQASRAALALSALWPSLEAGALANRVGMLQQSVDATAGLLGNTVQLLLRDAAWSARLLRSPRDACAVVAEIARWDAPVQNTRRWAAQDCVLEGLEIKQGQGLLLLLASANRDASLNPGPDLFDADRTARRSLTFGAGVHACPGEQIAVCIAATALRELGIAGRLDALFKPAGRYVPLPNARIPVFE